MGLWQRSTTRWAGAASALIVATGTLALVNPTGAAADSRSADLSQDAVTAAVGERLGDRAEDVGLAATENRTKIEITEQQEGWARGTAVLTTPQGSQEMPQGWVFMAQHVDGEWRVAFDGERRFTALAAESELTSETEREVLATHDDTSTKGAGDFRTGMGLPYATGQSWLMSGGPHGWGGTDTPWSALDFAGGDQKVRATRGGTAYTMCKGWVRVLHDRGYSTDYYHLWNNINVDGAAVNAGAYLGDTGTDITCGGSANGRHVHLGLRQHGAYTSIAGHNLGRWVLQNGGAAYQGSALHGSARVHAGGNLHNHGALGFTQGVVDTNGGTTLTKRAGPGTGYATRGSVADGVSVTVACSSNGTSHTGRWGTSSQWNKLSDGTWVSDAYLWTGVNGPVNGSC